MIRSAILCMGLAIMATSCGDTISKQWETRPTEPTGPIVKKAVVTLQPTRGHSVRGIITFTEDVAGVRVEGDVFNLTPGRHGFHIHQLGDVSAQDGTACGGHFNPSGEDHGGPTGGHRHAGDLGNLEADQSGYAHYERVDAVLQLSGPESIVGRSIIVHIDADDLSSQPTGNAGARVAQGVIGIAE